MSKQTEKIKALVEKRELARLGGGQLRGIRYVQTPSLS